MLALAIVSTMIFYGAAAISSLYHADRLSPPTKGQRGFEMFSQLALAGIWTFAIARNWSF